jgi:hypothetical protein
MRPYSGVVDSVFDTIAGLPVHPLVVHGAIVLVPLAALGALLMAAWPTFSRRFGSLVVIVAFVGAGASFVAKESGERLAERVGEPARHADLGAVMPLVAFGLFVLLLVFWLFDRGIPANKSRPVWMIVFAVVVILAALFTVYWTVLVGHSGAEAVWSSIIQNTKPGG